MAESHDDFFPVGDNPVVVARFRIQDRDLDVAKDPTGLSSNPDMGVVRFVLVAAGTFESLVTGLRLDSSASIELPDFGIDDDKTFNVAVHFYFGDSPIVVITAEEPPPKLVVVAIIHEALDEFPVNEEVEDLYAGARGVRWCLIRILRRRITAIEQSVRQALDDEHVTQADYAALREYAVRLAQVERLASESPEPTVKSYRPRNPYSLITEPAISDSFFGTLKDVAKDARESTARLSGLISSQQIVLTQRQAADAERFQRLLTLVGTAVLVPGLVAAVFGANVEFPGKDSDGGFYAMLCFMVASGLGSYVALSSVELSRRTEQASSAAHAHSTRTLIVLGLTACAAAVGGVLFLLFCG